MSWLVKRLRNHVQQWTTSGLIWIGSRWEGSSSLVLYTNKWVILYFFFIFYVFILFSWCVFCFCFVFFSPGGAGTVGYCRPRGLRQAEASLVPWHRCHPHVLFHRQPRQFRWETLFKTVFVWHRCKIHKLQGLQLRYMIKLYFTLLVLHKSVAFISAESRQLVPAKLSDC